MCDHIYNYHVPPPGTLVNNERDIWQVSKGYIILKTYTCVIGLGHHWFRLRLVLEQAPSHYIRNSNDRLSINQVTTKSLAFVKVNHCAPIVDKPTVTRTADDPVRQLIGQTLKTSKTNWESSFANGWCMDNRSNKVAYCKTFVVNIFNNWPCNMVLLPENCKLTWYAILGHNKVQWQW